MKTMKIRALACDVRPFALACSLGVALGCSSSSEATTTTPPDTTQADAGAKTPLGVWVVDTIVAGEAPKPLEGAVVAFDPPGGGERVEKTTGPDGHAVFEADVSLEGGAVTVFAADHPLLTLVALKPGNLAKVKKPLLGHPAEDVVAVMPPSRAWRDKRTVKLTGSITNRTSARASLGVIGVGAPFDGTSSLYEARVPRSMPFTLLGADYAISKPDARSLDAPLAKLFTIDRPALDQDATFDIDVAAATAVSTVTNKLHLAIPGGDSGPLGGTSMGRANVLESNGLFFPGLLRSSKPSADNSGFDCEIVVAQIDPKPYGLITSGAVTLIDGAISIRSELGILPDGSTLSDFLLPPKVSFDKAKRSAPIAIPEAPADVELVQLSLLDGDDLAWVVSMAKATGIPASLSVPAPPTNAKVASSLVGQLSYLAGQVDISDTQGFSKKIASSAPFTVDK
jgi:hypothetical protein